MKVEFTLGNIGLTESFIRDMEAYYIYTYDGKTFTSTIKDFHEFLEDLKFRKQYKMRERLIEAFSEKSELMLEYPELYFDASKLLEPGFLSELFETESGMGFFDKNFNKVDYISLSTDTKKEIVKLYLKSSEILELDETFPYNIEAIVLSIDGEVEFKKSFYKNLGYYRFLDKARTEISKDERFILKMLKDEDKFFSWTDAVEMDFPSIAEYVLVDCIRLSNISAKEVIDELMKSITTPEFSRIVNLIYNTKDFEEKFFNYVSGVCEGIDKNVTDELIEDLRSEIIAENRYEKSEDVIEFSIRNLGYALSDENEFEDAEEEEVTQNENIAIQTLIDYIKCKIEIN